MLLHDVIKLHNLPLFWMRKNIFHNITHCVFKVNLANYHWNRKFQGHVKSQNKISSSFRLIIKFQVLLTEITESSLFKTIFEYKKRSAECFGPQPLHVLHHHNLSWKKAMRDFVFRLNSLVMLRLRHSTSTALFGGTGFHQQWCVKTCSCSPGHV